MAYADDKEAVEGALDAALANTTHPYLSTVEVKKIVIDTIFPLLDALEARIAALEPGT